MFHLLAFHWPKAHDSDMWVLFDPGCGKTTGADLLGVESEPWVFKGGVSGEVQVGRVFVYNFPMDLSNSCSFFVGCECTLMLI